MFKRHEVSFRKKKELFKDKAKKFFLHYSNLVLYISSFNQTTLSQYQYIQQPSQGSEFSGISKGSPLRVFPLAEPLTCKKRYAQQVF